MNLFTSSLVVTLGFVLSVPSFASTINIDFGTPDTPPFKQSISTTATYTFAPGFQISATGYSIEDEDFVSPTPLFAKTNKGDEEGLGLANGGSSHEITPSNFIQLDLTNLIAFGATSFSLASDSTTGNDAFTLSLSSKKGVQGKFYLAGNTEKTYTFTAAQISATPFVSFNGVAGDVLLGPGTITNAPEPGTLLSLGAGLLVLAVPFRKQLCSYCRAA